MQKKWIYRLYVLLPGWVTKWAVFWLKPKYVIGVVALIPNQNKQLLVLHHTYRKVHAWRFPGGIKERFEHPFATAEREVWEETNMRVKAKRVVAVIPSEATFDVVVVCELLTAAAFTPNNEVDDLLWLNPNAPQVELPPRQKELLSMFVGHGELLS